MIEKPNYFAILPACVRYAKIPAIAKILFAEITALSNKKGFSNASNFYFSELYETTKRTISKNFQILENKGFIKIEIERSPAGTFRKIWPIIRPETRLETSSPRKKTSTPQEESFQPPRKKTSIQKNNTSNNNTRKNNKENTIKEKTQNKKILSFENKTALDITLNNFKFKPEFKPVLKNEILKYWRYLEEKKGASWGNVTTVKAQVYRFEKLIKEFTHKEIIESIQECILKGNTNFNPQWTKNRINKTKKTQQNEKTADNTKSLYKEYADYLSTGASATKDYFNNTEL